MEELKFTESLSAYRSLLLHLLGFYRPIEDRLAEFGSKEISLDLNERWKSQWIVDDLTYLGLSKADAAHIHCCQNLPRLDTRPDALGVLYVLEGSTLGGQVISKRLRQTLGVSHDTGGRFFNGYGDQTAVKWREFISLLACVNSGSATATAVEQSACRTFRSYGDWIGKLANSKRAVVAAGP
jgi:heme oxygenase